MDIQTLLENIENEFENDTRPEAQKNQTRLKMAGLFAAACGKMLANAVDNEKDTMQKMCIMTTFALCNKVLSNINELLEE